MKKIIPAILTKGEKELKEQLERVAGLADWVQIDVMDGEFVPNRSLSLTALKEIKTPLKLEIHLMVFEPERYFPVCQEIGARRVIFHREAVEEPLSVLKELARYKLKKGLAFNPETPMEDIEDYLETLDLILLLGVTPGFQGQEFNPIVLEKIKALRGISDKVKIEVDGGVNLETVGEIARAGADLLVVGSALFESADIRETYRLLEKKIRD